MAKGDGGMVTRGESGRLLARSVPLTDEVVLLKDEPLAAELLESYEVLRDRAGWEVGGLVEGFPADGSAPLSEPLSDGLSWKLKRALVPVVGAGLMMAGDILFKKSR